MKKLTNLILAGSLLSAASVSQADAIGLYAGAGIWQGEADNRVDVSALSADDISLGDDNSSFAYIALEHPIPLIPNFRIQQVNFDLGSNGAVDIDLDMTHQDAIAYYEILDNWVNLDLGISARRYDGSASVSNGTTLVKLNVDGVLPMIYAKAQFDLPFSGWSIGGDINATDFSGDQITDTSVRIAYESDIIPLFGLGAELGYRHMSMELDDLRYLDTDLTVTGPYAAITLHF
ncbi:MAG: TIGR04219 family outer membrane beta-barrel protein [Cellvibrionaceae bacterium]